ncbi:MAG TPA: hypothetical protein VNH42_06495 [Mariprofundaceae bacterium]|nr:hypothetical protein [Mariprofundaceae bacterium]
MTEETPKQDEHVTSPVESAWGKQADDHYGYASDEERKRKRGLEDWELVNSIPTSQKRVPKWFIGVIVAVAFVAISLSFPFFGLRKGMPFNWGGWGSGVIAAIVYLSVMSVFVLIMVRMYGSEMGGRLDNDAENDQEKKAENEHEEK